MNAKTSGTATLIEQAARRLREAERANEPGSARHGPPISEPAPSRSAIPADANREPDVRIDLPALKAQGYLTPGGERTRVAEEFRIIKRPLLDNAFGKSSAIVEHGNMIMVTSAVPGEGKTFTALEPRDEHRDGNGQDGPADRCRCRVARGCTRCWGHP
jgi:protein-tyrosine kinase